MWIVGALFKASVALLGTGKFHFDAIHACRCAPDWPARHGQARVPLADKPNPWKPPQGSFHRSYDSAPRLSFETPGVFGAHRAAGGAAGADFGAVAELFVEELLPAQVVDVLGVERREAAGDQGAEGGALG